MYVKQRGRDPGVVRTCIVQFDNQRFVAQSVNHPNTIAVMLRIKFKFPPDKGIQ